MGEWAVAELPKPDYSRQADHRVGLTDAGNALAADLGLLVADTLTGKHPQLEWETVRKPRFAAPKANPIRGVIH